MADIVFKALFVFFVAGLTLEWFFLDRLKKRHTQAWIDLGSPSLFFNNSISNAFKMMRFKRSQECKKLNDDFLDKLLFVEKCLFGIYLVLFIILILSIFGLSIQ